VVRRSGRQQVVHSFGRGRGGHRCARVDQAIFSKARRGQDAGTCLSTQGARGRAQRKIENIQQAQIALSGGGQAHGLPSRAAGRAIPRSRTAAVVAPSM